MDDRRRRALIARYRALPDDYAGAFAGADERALDAAPAPGEWSARQLAHHLADDELVDATRLRLMAAEDDPEITPYDERHFAARLHYDRPVGQSLDAIRAVRQSGAAILERLAPEDFERSGRHPEHDAYSVGIWLEKAVEHGEAHLDQLRRTLAAAPEVAAGGRDGLLRRYRDGPRVIAEAVAGATDEALDRRPPAPELWSAREVVHHVADSEMTSAIRLRRLIAEREPDLGAYDEELFAQRLRYDRPISASLDAIRAARASTAEILDRLEEAEWQRSGRHPEHASYTVDDWLRIYAEHCHEHAAQILRAIGR